MKNAFRILTCVSTLGFACIANALTTLNVWLDTSSLVGEHYLDFQLNDGGLLGNNSASISGFQFGGGNATADIGTFGGASGDLTAGVQITDSDFWNEFYQSFMPGSWLSFVVELTNNANNPGDFPDLFSFSILDGNLSNITTNSFGTDTLLEVNIDGLLPQIESFGGADDYSDIGAPRVSQVPEGSLYGIFYVVVFSMIAVNRKFRKQPAACAA